MGVTIKLKKGNATSLDAPSPEGKEDENKEKEEEKELPSGTLNEQIAFLIKQAGCSGLIPTAQPSEWVQSKCTDDPTYQSRYLAAIKKMLSLTKKVDFKKYFPTESKAQDNEKYRAKTLDPRLCEFQNYLIHVGVRPLEGWSVDRIDPKRGYIYGNMRWALPQTQTDNQRLKKWYEIPGKGQMNIGSFAKYLGQKYDTVYHALKRRNTVDQLINRYGARVDAEHSWEFPPNIAFDLEQAYLANKKTGQSRLAWCCQHLPQWMNELRSAGVQKSEIERMDVFFQETKAELQRIRNMKKVEKHKLAFAVLQGLKQPERREPYSFNTQMPKDVALRKVTQALGDDDGLVEGEYPAFGVVVRTPLALDKPAPTMHLVKPVNQSLPEPLETKESVGSDKKTAITKGERIPATYEELLADPDLAKYNKPWMFVNQTKKTGVDV